MVHKAAIYCSSHDANASLVMRRRHDDWINATHILKAAGFDKPARTRILEREVQKENHEKVQGGYGKYQGR
jgi:transcription factor MBP1